MLRNLVTKTEQTPTEGQLYKVVTTFGRTFELRYGYYDSIDRTRAPDIIYPDFSKEAMHTDGGEPFITLMQDACPHYEGSEARTEDTLCASCKHCRRGEEWFGICINPKNIKK